MGTAALLSGECVFFWFWDAVPRLMITSDEPLATTQSPIHAILVHTMFSYSLHRSMGGPWGGEPEETLGDPMDVHGGR